MPKTTPHPQQKNYFPDLAELDRLDKQIDALRRERAEILEDIPCGLYLHPRLGRFEVRLTRSGSISVRLLRVAGVHDDIIKFARRHAGMRKSVRKTPPVQEGV